jgi:hypothetical protein
LAIASLNTVSRRGRDRMERRDGDAAKQPTNSNAGSGMRGRKRRMQTVKMKTTTTTTTTIVVVVETRLQSSTARRSLKIANRRKNLLLAVLAEKPLRIWSSKEEQGTNMII